MHNVAQLRRLRERFPNDLVIIGVHSAKFPSEGITGNIREAAHRYGIEHPVLNDNRFLIWNAYAVRAWPTIILINPTGKIVETEPGEIDADDWIPRIEAILSDFEKQGLLNHAPLSFQSGESFMPRSLLSYPSRVITAPGDRLFVADTGNHRILELHLLPSGDAAEIVRAFGSGKPGLQDGALQKAEFHHPRGIYLFNDDLYVADTGNHAIRKINLTTGEINTIAGTGEKGNSRSYNKPEGPLPLRSPWAVLVLPGGQEQPIVFIAMAGTHQIWALLEGARLGIFAGTGQEALVDGPTAEASFNQPSDLAYGLGHLFVADPEASAIRAITLNRDLKVFTLVGQGLFEFGDIDGEGATVRLQHPTGVAFTEKPGIVGEEASGVLYIADSYNNKVKTLDPFTGRVETLIGTGTPGDKDGLFDKASLYEPEGLAVYGEWLYIADTNNHLIRIADLREHTLGTLALQGMDRLTEALSYAQEYMLLGPVSLAPCQASITLDIQLPPGYKLNPDSPVIIRFLQDSTSKIIRFPAGEPVIIEADVCQEPELVFDLTLYYCQVEDARLCLIHDRRVTLPMRVEEGAPSSAQVLYAVQESGSFTQPSA
jgi:hypothetical protein